MFPDHLDHPGCEDEVATLLHLAKQKNLRPSQRSRLQIVALFDCIRRCIPPDAIISNISSILIALATVVTCTSSNHRGLDIILGLDTKVPDIQTFLYHFSSYESAEAFIRTLEIGSGLIDVFGEYTWNKLCKEGWSTSEFRLQRCVAALSAVKEWPANIHVVTGILTNAATSPPIVGGDLFVFLTIGLFVKLNLVTQDSDWRSYRPKKFTDDAGSVNYLQQVLGHSLTPVDVCACLETLLVHLPISNNLLDVENIACKALVLGFLNPEKQATVLASMERSGQSEYVRGPQTRTTIKLPEYLEASNMMFAELVQNNLIYQNYEMAVVPEANPLSSCFDRIFPIVAGGFVLLCFVVVYFAVIDGHCSLYPSLISVDMTQKNEACTMVHCAVGLGAVWGLSTVLNVVTQVWLRVVGTSTSSTEMVLPTLAIYQDVRITWGSKDYNGTIVSQETRNKWSVLFVDSNDDVTGEYCEMTKSDLVPLEIGQGRSRQSRRWEWWERWVAGYLPTIFGRACCPARAVQLVIFVLYSAEWWQQWVYKVKTRHEDIGGGKKVKQRSTCSGCGNEGRIHTCKNESCQVRYATMKAAREAKKEAAIE